MKLHNQFEEHRPSPYYLASIWFVIFSSFFAYNSVLGIGITLPQEFILSAISAAFVWLLLRKKKYMSFALLAFLCFVIFVFFNSKAFLCGIKEYANAFIVQLNQYYGYELKKFPISWGQAADSAKVMGLLLSSSMAHLLLTIFLTAALRLFPNVLLLGFLTFWPLLPTAIAGTLPETLPSCLMLSSFAFLMSTNRIRRLREYLIPAVSLLLIIVVTSVIFPLASSQKELHQQDYASIRATLIHQQDLLRTGLGLKEAHQMPESKEPSASFTSESDTLFAGYGDGNLQGLRSLTQTGEVIDHVTLDTEPQSDVYIRHFIGGTYTSEKWLPAASAREQEYLAIPKSLTALSMITDSFSYASSEDVSENIDAFFHDGFTYTLSPGGVPADWDFTEYFLTQKKAGFCVHFATAATLLYRSCGYPSRFVSGYAIPKSAFYKMNDGRWTADVTDKMAHAWCEVYDESSKATYLDDSAWMIREHTLSYSNVSTDADGPVANSPLDAPSPENPPNDTPSDTQAQNMPQKDQPEVPLTPSVSDESITTGNTFSQSLAVIGHILLRIVLIILTAVLFLALCLWMIMLRASAIRKRRRRIIRGKNTARSILLLFEQFALLCEFAGMPKHLSDEEMISYMQSQFTELSANEWNWLYDIAREARFYGEPPADENRKKYYAYYKQFRKSILNQLGKKKRAQFLYIAVL